ncbi:MAG TPA: YdcF family protein [Clostridia bacterium]|nr:YdcF family protein [Clostridia bacterium]
MNRIISDITDFIFVSDKLQNADIIFLPGGSFPEIPEKAAELYHEGYVPLLLPSGGVSVKTGKFAGVKSKQETYGNNYQTDCEFYTDVLLKNGVPPQAILCEDESGHTRDNAFFSRKVADANGLRIKSALIVCKSFHARRCLMLYQLAFPEAEILVCPVDCYGVTKDNWHMSEYGIDRVLGELARCGNQFVGEIKECCRSL